MEELEITTTESGVTVKNPLTSKTVIANAIVFAIGIIALIDADLAQQIGISYPVLIQIVAVLNLVLRFVTSSAISFNAQ